MSAPLLPSIFFSLVLCSESFALSRGFAAGEQVLDTGRQVGFVKAPLLDLILSKTTPLNLDRKEQFFIERFRTNTIGMNRMMVVT